MVTLSWNRSFSRISNTTDEKQKNCREMGEGLDGTRSGPHTLQVQNGGPVNWYTSVITIPSYQCRALFGLLFLKKATRAFCYPALLTVDGLSSKGLEKIKGSKARICLCNLCMYGHAPLLMGIYNNYSGYDKVRQRLYVNERFVKLTLSGKNV